MCPLQAEPEAERGAGGAEGRTRQAEGGGGGEGDAAARARVSGWRAEGRECFRVFAASANSKMEFHHVRY